MTTLCIEQGTIQDDGKYLIALRLKQPGQPNLEGEATIEFALSDQEQNDLTWYMEDFLQESGVIADVVPQQVESMMRQRGLELYHKVLDDNDDTRAIWFAVRNQLAELRVEIHSQVREAASIPWELMRDQQSDTPLALRVKSFVRTYLKPSIAFVPVPLAEQGCLRLLYVVCRPRGAQDVKLRAVANRLMQDLGAERERFEITALRPPTFERLQEVLKQAKDASKPFHIVHFDGHGVYMDLGETKLAEWAKAIGALMLGGGTNGPHGYLIFENLSSKENMRPVSGKEIGQVLHDNGVPVLVLNACQSAMSEVAAGDQAAPGGDVHEQVRELGSLAQEIVDQGIPAVLGMRYSVYVNTAAQYIGQLYSGLAHGLPFGEAASQGRKHLARNPERWVGLVPRALQDWFVPVVYEASPLHLLPPKSEGTLQLQPQAAPDPVQANPALLRHVPDTGFIGRDETLLALDRAFDEHAVVLLHAYAGQGKSAAAVEFARWYAQTGGLSAHPLVLLTSFEQPTDLGDALNQLGGLFTEALRSSGIEWHALNDLGARRNIVLQILRQVPLLWIWDNVEPVAGFPEGTPSQWTQGEQDELRDFLQLVKENKSTRARFLLTSRRDEQKWLGGIPKRIRMRPMRPEDAAGLALSLGAEKKADEKEMANWQALLDYCQGNPLTLRVLVGQAVRQGLHGYERIRDFVEAIRIGEQAIHDVDWQQGRDISLGASLDYGFKSAFQEDELPIIALLHMFQGNVQAVMLAFMGAEGNNYALPELKGRDWERLNGLLGRACGASLLNSLGGGYYSIHPALPWYLRQIFAQYYDGQAGRSSAEAAERAWVEAIGALGDYYWDQYEAGNREVVQFLAWEEANLLQAHRRAWRNGWWDALIGTMQGLKMLYEYQGRTAEWARLVAEITPEYCTPENDPIADREDTYTLVMGYRVKLAQEYAHDLPEAAVLQEKLVAWDRRRAAVALALPEGAPLDDHQRNLIRMLAVSLEFLGHILREQGNPDCVQQYEEVIHYYQRIQGKQSEAIVHYNLGRAYMEIPTIRDLDKSEAAYRRCLELRPPQDALGRSRCIQQIGMVEHERFREARRGSQSQEIIIKHLRATEEYYLQALKLCPPSALSDRGPIHHQLGLFYKEVGQIEPAREHYGQAAQYYEQIGDRYHAGQTRYNMALMYGDATRREASASRQRDLLERAQAYAEAALRDYQSYQGRAAEKEAKARQLILEIEQEMEKGAG